jgi:Tfp pilus assembly protein PilN
MVKKNNLTKNHLLSYLAYEILSFNEKTTQHVIQTISATLPIWFKLINHSYLSKNMKQKYLTHLSQRAERLELNGGGTKDVLRTL